MLEFILTFVGAVGLAFAALAATVAFFALIWMALAEAWEAMQKRKHGETLLYLVMGLSYLLGYP